jgi:hypothetical protein
MEVYNKNISNDDKYREVSMLWTEYYKLSNKLGIRLDLAYNLYLMNESECYKVYQEPILKNIDKNMVLSSINHLKKVLNNKSNGIVDGISREEAIILLDFCVNNVRSSFSLLGINIKTNSLNGFCSLGQALSIMPFENLGLKVTKNKARDAFGYQFNHSFGTVFFPILEDNILREEGYLIDTTYRQFFSSVRCNEGRYYTVEENTGIVANPDPGYFIEDKEFAKKLMADGYVKFDEKNAYLYGKPFYLSTLGIRDKNLSCNGNFDYFSAILNSSSDYSLSYNELDEMNVDCFNFNNKVR